MSITFRYIVLLLLFCIFKFGDSNIFAQVIDQKVLIEEIDTTAQVKPQRNTFLQIFRGNPGRAALYSLVIPGAGQAYNRKWWKVPIAIGIDGAALSYVFLNKSKFIQYDGIYRNLISGVKDPVFSSPGDVKPIRDAYRQRYEYAWLYFGVAHLITVFDAFVDRHLIEFDISEDLTYYDKRLNTSGAMPIVCFSIPFGK